MFNNNLHKSLSSLTSSHTCLLSSTMSDTFVYPSQPVFMVDSDRNHPKQQRYYHQQVPRPTEPPLVPCWTFPPARTERKKRGWGGMSVGIVWVLILILLLVFAALGLGAYQILRLQTEVELLKRQEMATELQSITPQRQVGQNRVDFTKTKQNSAAHLIGSPNQSPSPETPLNWESKVVGAFMQGIKYSNGGLQVNETGLYFIYSRVEFRSPTCKDFASHKLSLRRHGKNRIIMEDHREGFCVAGSNKPWMTGSHLGSTYLLEESDLLFVKVSDPRLLSKNYHGNYFGLFKID